MEGTTQSSGAAHRRIRIIGRIGQTIMTMVMLIFGLLIICMPILVVFGDAFPTEFPGMIFDADSTVEFAGYAGPLKAATIGLKLGACALWLAVGGAVMLISWMVRKVFVQLSEGRLFTRLNSSIAMAAAVLCLGKFIACLFGFNLSADGLVAVGGAGKSLPMSEVNEVVRHAHGFCIMPQWLLLGLFLLALSWGIRQAVALKEENDLTV